MILVTGATGHIGNVLVRTLLKQGQKVRALILPGEAAISLEGLDVEKVSGNVLDFASLKDAVHGVDLVFHLAGAITIMPGEQPDVWRVNVEGTRNMLHAARNANLNRFVYTSSIHAVQRVDTGIIDESLPFDPNNPYGTYDRSKAIASLEVQGAAQQSMDTVIVCPTGVIGPYDFFGSEMGHVIASTMKHGLNPYVEGAYDFVDVRDVVDGLILAGEKGKTGESYILSGHAISIRYLLETLREIIGLNFPMIKIPSQVAEFFAKFTPTYYRLTKRTPRFTPYSLEVLNSNANISHTKASRELGYQPRALYQTLVDTVVWLLENRTLLEDQL
ncbi:MAG: NAD-dependent epimerase/dehydratase family protein [Chloroflexi bacterium]|nr:NAD-dependent epimerase/dehydratase family protein [Chloroflexota bacterium]